jgi:hypothetical protein
MLSVFRIGLIQVGQHTTLSLAKKAINLHTLDLSWCRNLTDNEFGLIVDNCMSLRFLKLFGCSQVNNSIKRISSDQFHIVMKKYINMISY